MAKRCGARNKWRAWALTTLVLVGCSTSPTLTQDQPTSTTTTTTTGSNTDVASIAPESDVYPPDFECNGRSGTEIFDYQAGAEGAETIEEAVQPFLEDGDTLVDGWSESGGIVAVEDRSGKVGTYVNVNQWENGWLVGSVLRCVN